MPHRVQDQVSRYTESQRCADAKSILRRNTESDDGHYDQKNQGMGKNTAILKSLLEDDASNGFVDDIRQERSHKQHPDIHAPGQRFE